MHQDPVHEDRRQQTGPAPRIIKRIRQRILDRDRDHGISEPAEPFEEIIRMARPAPQADVAYPALVGGVGAEIPELGVGERLAGDADQQDQRAEIIRKPQRGLRKPRRHENRKHQRDRSETLVLQEHEHPARRIGAPFAGEGGVARVVGDPGRAHRNMEAKPDRPDRHQSRNQPLPGIRRRIGHRP